MSRVLRRTTALLAGAVLVLLTSLVGAPPAQAHDRLEQSAPADGSVVDVAPASVVLTFSAPVIALGSKVVVTAPDGAVVSTGDLQLVDSTATQQLTGDLPAGQYRVEWRVTSSDGHPVSGSFAYTASAAATGSGSASSSGTAPATPSTSAPAAPSAVPSAGPTAAEPDATPVAASSAGAPPWVLVVSAVAVLGAVAAAAASVVRRRR